MNVLDILRSTLLDLLYELRDTDLPLILGGGYGLYLKQQQAAESDAPLLLKAVPPVRSTNDLDLFLRTDVIADSTRLRPLREALDRLDFTVIPSAQNYQFARRLAADGRVWDIKVDLLTKTPDRQRFPNIKMDERRVRPYPSVGLHAHRTDEAIAIEEGLAEVSLTGLRTTGEAYTGALYLPSTYALLMMKLFALRDQVNDEEKGFGRKHALDLYTLIAILTEPEYARTQALNPRFRETEEAQEAARIVADLFATVNASGMLRVRENEALPAHADLAEFRAILQELFPTEDTVNSQLSASHPL